VRAIHDDRGIAAAMPALAGTLGVWSGAEEPGMVRRVLSANLKVGTADAARRLGEYASQGANPELLRLEALECLGEWARPTSLDRVEGYVQTRGARDPGLGDAEILRRFEAITHAGGRSVLNALVRLVLENDLAVDAGTFARWALSAEQPTGVRAQALEWLARKDPARLAEALLRAAADPELEVRLAALRIEAAHVPEALVRRVVSESSGWSIPERQAAFALLGPMVGETAARWIGAALDDLAAGRLPAELAVDVWSAAAQRSEPEWARKLSEMEGRLAAGDALAPYRAVLAGGDARRGEAIFRHHANAQCVRCHDAGGEGQQVGPVLKGVATRLTAEQLLEAIVEPSARIADGFATYSVELRDGTELDGVRLAETPEWLTLRLANSEVKRLARGDLRRQSVSTVSAMPPMGPVLTRFELRDLIAYLKTLN
jgi:quinoprotein glucose dehydrogenase